MNLIEKFEKGVNTNSYLRIDPEYKVDIFLGYNEDGKMSMSITESGKTERITSSKLIDVHLKQRKDSKLALSFDLLDSAYAPMFLVFCKDIILVCENSGKDEAIASALKRWKYWKEMFGKKNSLLLEKHEIKGLIGELSELKNRMITKFGHFEAVKGWMGPLSGHKDFELGGSWYEVKTVNSGANQLIISSLEQLESEIDGHLIVVRADEVNENSERTTNLNKLVTQIVDMIEDPEVLEELRIKLGKVGYSFEVEYNDYNYVIKGSDIYRVNEDFPRLRRSAINEAIGNAKYTIMIAGLTKYKE